MNEPPSWIHWANPNYGQSCPWGQETRISTHTHTHTLLEEVEVALVVPICRPNSSTNLTRIIRNQMAHWSHSLALSNAKEFNFVACFQGKPRGHEQEANNCIYFGYFQHILLSDIASIFQNYSMSLFFAFPLTCVDSARQEQTNRKKEKAMTKIPHFEWSFFPNESPSLCPLPGLCRQRRKILASPQNKNIEEEANQGLWI